jgi:Protein of unknown function (DUF2516)
MTVPLAFQIRAWLDLAVLVLALVLTFWAFIHASLQRRDAFAAIGGLQKQHWVGLLGAFFLLTLLLGGLVNFQLMCYIGIGGALYYLLDTRRGLKDVSEGPW